MSYQINLESVSRRLITEMLQVKEGEVVAITLDAESRFDIIDHLSQIVSQLGGIPMTIEVPIGSGDGEIGVQDWPAKALTGALIHTDVWLDMGSIVMLYSSIWETVMKDNKDIRYLVLGNSSLDSLERVFNRFNISALSKLLNNIMAMAKQARSIRVTSKNGTDVSYEIEPTFTFDIDDGDYSKPIFGTAPGYVNIVPKLGSMNGRIVFDALADTTVFSEGGEVAFKMERGIIKAIEGNEEAEAFKAYLSSFNDPNMYKISHNMIGLNPGVRALTGEIVEDERIWGGVDFGFGHTSPLDMPPHGQVAKSHFDGIIQNASIYIDDMIIIEDGQVIHPELIPIAKRLLDDATKSN